MNLEHGWLVGREKDDKGEIVGYCEECQEDIYEGDEFVKIDGVLYCQKCHENYLELLEREEEDYDQV